MNSTFKKFFKYFFILIFLGGGFQVNSSITDGSIDILNKTALLCLNDSCSSTSQINFLTTKGDPVRITDSSLTGHAWSETFGWINLNPTNGGVNNTSSGVLSGYAWGENAGWVNFAPTNGGVTIGNDGEFIGYAWSENYGWIKFDCSVTNACVKTDWRPESQRGSGGSSGSYAGGGNNNIDNVDVVDICPNITGDQTLIPPGLVIDGASNCVSPQQCNIINSALKQPLDVMIVMDRSGSMSGIKMTQAKSAANTFIDNLIPGSDRVGYVAYSDSALLINKLTTSVSSVKSNINATKASGYTNIGGAIKIAHQELDENARQDVKSIIILLTDGVTNVSDIKGQTPKQYAINQANIAKSGNSIIYTVGLGTSLDSNLLRSIASLPENYYYSPTGNDLSSIYLEIAAIECTARPSLVYDRVIHDTNNNGVADSNESGFVGATITLISKDGSHPPLTTISKDDGDFRFPNVVEGEYFMCIQEKPNIVQTYPSDNKCYDISITQGIDVTGLYFLISGNLINLPEENDIDIDTDGDDFTDEQEEYSGTDPNDPLDKPVDTDNDGLIDEEDVNNYQSDPNDPTNPNDPGLSSDDNNINKRVNNIDNNFINILENLGDGVASLFNLLDFKEGSIYEARLFLDKIFKDELGKMTSRFVSTVGVATGLYSGVISVAFSNPISISELYLLPMRLWNLLLLALGLKKRSRPWGTVYDSTTKQPLDPAFVVLEDLNGNEVATSITDLDGRYGFLVPAGTYRMIANKTNYLFPSKKLYGRNQDELYQDLYFSEIIEVKEGEVISKNIPMDSIKFDWNEFAKKDQKLMKFFSKKKLWMARISDTLFMLGFFVSLAGIIVNPIAYNVIVFSLYLILFIFRKLILKPRAIGHIRYKLSHNPLSFAIMRVFFAGSEQEVIHKVSDMSGRYYCLIPNGVYFVKIENKNPDETYSLAHISDPIEVKKGHIDKNFEV